MKRKLHQPFHSFFKTDFGQTIRDSWTYLSGNIALRSLSFIGIPIMTRLFTEEDYGIVNIFSTYAVIAGTIFTLNTHVGVGRYYFEEDSNYKAYLGTALSVVIGMLAIASCLLHLFINPVSDLLGIPPKTVYFLVPFALASIIKSMHLQLFRATRAAKKVRSLNIITGYLGFALSVFLVYFHPIPDRYMGQLWAGLVMMVITLIIVLYRLKSHIKFAFSWDHILYMFSFGVPLMPAYLSGFILAQFDRVMIGSYLGKAEAGQYSFAYNISMLMVMVVNAFFYSWTPKYFEYMKAENYEQHDKDSLKLLSIVSFLACGLILFSDWIGYILGSESFHKSLYLIPLIVLGQYLMAINPIYKRHISFSKRTIYTSVIVLVAGALNIWLNSIYIPRFGAAAGAYTTVASYLVMFVLTYIAVKHFIKLHTTPLVKIGAKIIVVVAVCGYYYLDLYLLDIAVYLQILFKVGVLLLSGLLLMWKLLPLKTGGLPSA